MLHYHVKPRTRLKVIGIRIRAISNLKIYNLEPITKLSTLKENQHIGSERSKTQKTVHYAHASNVHRIVADDMMMMIDELMRIEPKIESDRGVRRRCLNI